MLEKTTIIKVTNRGNCYVGYTIPELNNLHRRFAPGETKEVEMNELRALVWTRGGQSILENYLVLDNMDAVNELVPNAEPEYFYTSKDVEALLINGSLDQVKDALDFAPEGVVSLIKETAVNTKLNDVAKREAIKEKTSFDVSRAIEINEESKSTTTTEEIKTRRAAPVNAVEDNGRRSASPYKIVKSN